MGDCDLKIVSNIFLCMKAKNHNLALWQSLLEVWCFKDAEKFIFLFFNFWLGLLLCKLLCNGFGELVLVMERDPSCSKDTFYEQCETRFCGRISLEILGEQKKVEKKEIN